jgi:hypothetical protein
MDILESTNKLLTWFTTNDVFTLHGMGKGDDQYQLIPISENPKLDRASVIGALNELEKINLVNFVRLGNTSYWILKKPLSTYDQTVLVDTFTASQIAETLNTFCKKTNNSIDLCNASQITSKDITNLLLIAKHFSKDIAQQ